MDITLQKILEDYWSQTLLLLTAIGFILRMTFSFFLKKKEINHGIIHKNRMVALVGFFHAYAELKSMWIKLPIFKIYKNELKSDDVDGQIQPSLNNFEATIIELQIYFDGEMYVKFKLIETNMLALNARFLGIASEFSFGRSVVQMTGEYDLFRQDIEMKNEAILKEISTELSKKYK
jgi:hypothetical protein